MTEPVTPVGEDDPLCPGSGRHPERLPSSSSTVECVYCGAKVTLHALRWPTTVARDAKLADHARPPDADTRNKVLVEHAERTIASALDTLRMLTPEGWERAWSLALADPSWNTNDIAMLRDARLLSMRGGPRLKPPRSGSTPKEADRG